MWPRWEMTRAIQTVTELRERVARVETCPRRSSALSSQLFCPAFLRTRSGSLRFSPCPPIGRRGSTPASIAARARPSRCLLLGAPISPASWTFGSSQASGSGTALENRETSSVAPDVLIRLLPPLRAACFSLAPFLESGRRGQETCPLQPTSTSRQKAVVVRWAVPAVEGLPRLLQFGDVGRFLSSEIDRLEAPINQPEGWEYPWYGGARGDVYRGATPVPAPGDWLLHARRGHESAKRRTSPFYS